jgi:hypothetical protein
MEFFIAGFFVPGVLFGFDIRNDEREKTLNIFFGVIGLTFGWEVGE